MTVNDINPNDYQDRTDVTFSISLYEQGCVRNHETDQVLYPLIPYAGSYINPAEDEDYAHESVELGVTWISLEDVRQELLHVDDGYFSFIGSDRNTELRNLNNMYLTSHIQALNSYMCAFYY